MPIKNEVKEPEEPGFYWAHCNGPDGPVVLLIKYHRHGFDIIEDGRDEEELCDGRLHKWKVSRFTKVVRPDFSSEPNPIQPRVLSVLHDAGYLEEDIEEFTPKEMFNIFCNWEGLPRWGNILWDIVTELKTQ